MTKEEILNGALKRLILRTSARDVIEDAMDEYAGSMIKQIGQVTYEYQVPKQMLDEYAKRQAISFIKYCFEQGIISGDFDGVYGVYFDGNYFSDPSFSGSVIDGYNKFIEQQNKTNDQGKEG